MAVSIGQSVILAHLRNAKKKRTSRVRSANSKSEKLEGDTEQRTKISRGRDKEHGEKNNDWQSYSTKCDRT